MGYSTPFFQKTGSPFLRNGTPPFHENRKPKGMERNGKERNGKEREKEEEPNNTELVDLLFVPVVIPFLLNDKTEQSDSAESVNLRSVQTAQ